MTQNKKCTVVNWVIRKQQKLQLFWLIPMVAGYTLATTATLLYASSPRYWYGLGQHGSYPLIGMGYVAGLLMMYGWIRFVAIFLAKLSNMIPVLPQLTREAQPGVWPPPPDTPEPGKPAV